LIARNDFKIGTALRLSEQQITGALVSLRKAIATNDNLVGCS
jgi:hypothetical protein